MEQLLNFMDISELIAAAVGALIAAGAFGVKKLFSKVDEFVVGTPNQWDDEAWAKIKEAIRTAVKDSE